jgi:hypothetical protein
MRAEDFSGEKCTRPFPIDSVRFFHVRGLGLGRFNEWSPAVGDGQSFRQVMEYEADGPSG